MLTSQYYELYTENAIYIHLLNVFLIYSVQVEVLVCQSKFEFIFSYTGHTYLSAELELVNLSIPFFSGNILSH